MKHDITTFLHSNHALFLLFLNRTTGLNQLGAIVSNGWVCLLSLGGGTTLSRATLKSAKQVASIAAEIGDSLSEILNPLMPTDSKENLQLLQIGWYKGCQQSYVCNAKPHSTAVVGEQDDSFLTPLPKGTRS